MFADALEKPSPWASPCDSPLLAGTDLCFGIEGRVANVLTNIPEPGELGPIPDIEVNVVPVTGSAEGTIIADASVPYLGIGILGRTDRVCGARGLHRRDDRRRSG